MFGAWQTSPEQYAEEAQGWMEQIGGMDWASQQDSMCEPFITEKTGRTVTAHQQDTVENYHQLVRLAPSVPWVPVLQGWEHGDYIRHLRMWEASGVDLCFLPRVGLGSVCRRQDTSLAEELIRDLHAEGIKIHGFGFKLRGLARVAPFLASSDSLAWSYNARKNQPLAECKHRKCSSCLAFAMRWRRRVDSLVGQRCADLSQKTLPFPYRPETQR